MLTKTTLKFTPKLWSTLLTATVVTLFCTLGVWQYHRAQFKKKLLADYAARQVLTPIKLADIKNPEDALFYPIEIEGFFDTEHQLLIENKFHNHQIGVEVLTPLVLKDRSIVLVNRGWVVEAPPSKPAAQKARIDDQTRIMGIIHSIPKKIFKIGEIPVTSTWPKYIQNNSWDEIKRVMPNNKFKPFIIVLDKRDKHSFTPIFTPSIMPPERHLGYAFQWFAMALAILIIFVAVNTKRSDNAKIKP